MLLNKIILSAYFALLIATAIYYRLKDSSSSTQTSNISINSYFALAVAMLVNSIGGGTVFGLGEKTFSGDLTIALGLLLSIPSDILAGIFITPKIAAKNKLRSIGGIMEEYYGKYGRIFTGICASMVSIGYIAIQINISTKIFASILNIRPNIGALISYAVVVSYTLIGGLRSTLKTNIIQFISLIVAIPVVSLLSIQKVGAQTLIDNFVHFERKNILFIPVLMTALGFACMGLDPALMKRNLIANTPKITTSAMLLKSAMYGICILLLTLNGLAAKNLFPDIHPTSVIPTLVNHLLPAGISGIVIVGLFAAVMSTADSSLQIAIEHVKEDVLMPLKLAKNLNSEFFNDVLSKILVVFAGSLSIFTSLKFEYAIDLAFFVAGIWFPVTVVPLLAALYNIHISKTGLVFNSIIALGSFILLEMLVLPFGLKNVFISTLISCTTFALIKIFEKPQSTKIA
jgi:Na+/proline symporter